MSSNYNRTPRNIFGWKGDTGAPGANGNNGLSVSSGTVNASGHLILTLSDNSTVDVGTVVGPQGNPGANGDNGSAATISIGTITTGAAGTSASVTNSGTSSAAVFDFTIPKGADGSGTGDMLASTYDPDSDGKIDTAQIKDKAITLDKMADMATASMLGRVTAESGTPEVLSAAQVRTLLNVADGAEANQNAFAIVAVDGQTTVAAGEESAALTLVAGTNVTITTDNTAKSITIAAESGGLNADGVRGTALTGFTAVTKAALAATDTILEAFEKLSALVTDLDTSKAAALITTNAQTGATYTLALTDKDKLVELSNAEAIALTVPTNASVAFPVGTKIDLLQTGAGQVTVAGASGVTVNAAPGLKLSGQWAGATLIKRASDTWVLIGSLSA